jgi:hypothetical protein
MYPLKRSLVTTYKDKPFALVGVNADRDRLTLVTAMKQEKINWRSFLDGGPGGTIAKAWHIRGYPSTFVLDHHGIIRSQGLRGELLEKAVRDLLQEQEADAKAQSAKGGEARQAEFSDREVAQLSDQVVDAPASSRLKMIEKLRDAKGPQNTLALAQAIAKLEGDAKKQAREALADRLANMKASTLEGYLEDDNPELRRAAALAVAMKDETELVGKLIDLLDDPEKSVERAAYAALKALTKQDFGPLANASASTKAKAVRAWKAWWQKHER